MSDWLWGKASGFSHVIPRRHGLSASILPNVVKSEATVKFPGDFELGVCSFGRCCAGNIYPNRFLPDGMVGTVVLYAFLPFRCSRQDELFSFKINSPEFVSPHRSAWSSGDP